MLGLQIGKRALRRLELIDVVRRNFRAHPLIEFLVEHRQSAGEEDGEQQPAENQPAPGVQPGELLGDGLYLAHASALVTCGQNPTSASGAAHANSHQARAALRQAKAQRMANG